MSTVAGCSHGSATINCIAVRMSRRESLVDGVR